MKINSKENNKILIVDDNTKNIQVLANALSKAGYDIDYAVNGNEAIESIKQENFTLILLDIMMPEKDGFEVCREIKSIKEKAEISIIFLTAKNDIESITKGFVAGGVDYITKPFNTAELLSRVKAHIDLYNSKKEIINLYNELKTKDKEITDSMYYAQRIQNSVLTSKKNINHILPKNFIIFQPQKIISGDFYWIDKIGEYIVIAVADCTGHGVPGAFMSMLGVSFLNEIVRKKEVTQANQILNNLRQQVIESLQQKGVAGEQKDGMDIALSVINTKTDELQFAGANNPLYLVREQELTEIKSDKMPIGYYYKMDEFTNNEIKLNKGDKLFLFSDGYPDQFGGEKGKKFLHKHLKRLIAETSSLPMKEQGKAMKKKLDNWMNYNNKKYEQVDDITVVGIKI